MSNAVPENQPKPIFTNQQYDILKRVVMYVLPALGTLYFTLSQIWGLPRGEEVIGSITALTIFLSVSLGFSSKAYEKNGFDTDGSIVIDTSDPDTDVYRLVLNSDPEDLKNMSRVKFKIDDLSHE